VTDDDLRMGESNDCKRCPVARAILRQVADIEDIDVDGEVVELKLVCMPRRSYPLPEAVQTNIALIDDGHRVGEFSFDLPLE
jgi:hypothetical protein